MDLLNKVIRCLDELTIFRNYEDKDDLVRIIRRNIVNTRKTINELQVKLDEETFEYDDYINLQETLSFQNFTENFFNAVKDTFMDQLDNLEMLCDSLGKTPLQLLEILELELGEFCIAHSLTRPGQKGKKVHGKIDVPDCNYYFEYSLFGESIDEERHKEENKKEMLNKVKKALPTLIIEGKNEAEILIPGMEKFNAYFANVKLGGAGLKPNVIAIIDDKTNKDCDFLLSIDGFIIVEKNMVQPTRDYSVVKFAKSNSRDELEIGWPDKYANENINIINLYNLIQELSDIAAFAK